MPTNNNHPISLYEAALTYRVQGWAVIPATHEKKPAVRWKTFQTQHPTAEQLTRWFHYEKHTGIAIITGSISRLLVLDFDNAERYHDFTQQFPDLLPARTVHTRRGQHVYFVLPPDTYIASRSVPGIDLQAEGSYVIAPPTTINGHTYYSQNGGTLVTLTPDHLSRIQAFLDQYTTRKHLNVPNTLQTSANPAHAADLITLYERHAVLNGRNNALFLTALYARDTGFTRAETEILLTPLHVSYPAPASCSHRRETPQQRYQEAHRTIASAYTRLPRPQAQPTLSATLSLPNTIREALLQRPDGAALLRTLEGLLLAGVCNTDPFTETDACTLLTNTVGRRTIRRALKALGSDDQPFFERYVEPECPPEPPVGTDIDPDTIQMHKCTPPNAKIAGQSGTKITRRRGRPAKKYLLPSIKVLCQRLGIKHPTNLRTDPLMRDDLKSPRALRTALEYRMIQRRPAQYFQAALAQRLGVSDRTIRRYHRHANIHAEPCYIDTYITFHNAHHLPNELELEHTLTGGFFLQDAAGSRYPALCEIARKLLQRQQSVLLRQQTANFYWCGEVKPLSPKPQPRTVPTFVAVRAADAVRAEPVPAQPSTPPPPLPPSLPPTPPVIVTPRPDAPRLILSIQYSEPPKPPTPLPPPRPKRYYRKPLDNPAMEQLAERVHDAANELSLVNARRLIDAFGVDAVQQALNQLLHPSRRGKIRKPAGFMITISGTCWRRLNPDVITRPRFTPEPVRHPKKRR